MGYPPLTVLLLLALSTCAQVLAFSVSASQNILILDHLNINHCKGRHDLLKSFYFDFLQCSVDPRKADNLSKESNTLWANIGANQFHLPEGKPDAQVFDGIITLSYPTLDGLRERSQDGRILSALNGSKFQVKEEQGGSLLITDPWGSTFRCVKAEHPDLELDQRGVQKGDSSEGLAMRDLTVYVPEDSNIEGIGRFYEHIFGAPVIDSVDGMACTISVGPRQTLSFACHPDGGSHDDLRDEDPVEGKPHYLSNYGPHISMYVTDLRSCYERAAELGLAYVNPRFKRRAYTLDEAVDQCMFRCPANHLVYDYYKRCLDIVDPENIEDGPILKLEHEVRSVVKRDGSKYKSCPFDEIPESCVA